MGFSNSSLVNYTLLSPNFGTRTHIIDTITIHCFVGQVTVQRGCEVFRNSENSSCNYVIAKDGQIGLVVPEMYRAFTSSNRTNDNRAVTIEVASDTLSPYAVTNQAYDSLITLVADICKRNNIKKLVWSEYKKDRVNHLNGCNMTVHRDFKNKACPGDYLYSRHGEIANRVNALLGIPISTEYTTKDFIKELQTAIKVVPDGIVGPKTLAALPIISTSKNRKHNAVRPLQKRLNTLGYGCGEPDGIFGAKGANALKAFQKSKGLTADGVCGQNTWKALTK